MPNVYAGSAMAAPEGIVIRYTPTGLALQSKAGAEIGWLADERSRDREGRLTPTVLSELASSGWLRADGQRRGGYLSTSGPGRPRPPGVDADQRTGDA